MFKTLSKLVVLIGLLSFVPSVYARAKLQGYCEDGGKTVSTLGVNSITKVQQSYPNCTVTVYNTGTVTLANIYSDNSGTVLSNPFTASNTGVWYFYADNNTYDVRFSNASIPTPFTLGAQSIIDPMIIGGIRYADTFPGADPCIKIRNAIANLPANGGTVDARAFFGTYSCSVNPFMDGHIATNVILGAVTLNIDIPWELNTSNTLIGGGRENNLFYNTILRTSSSFPSDTAMIQMCHYSQGFPCFGVQVTDLEMDCNYTSGCIGGENLIAEELSWFRRVLVLHAEGTGIKLGALPTPYGAQNSGPYADIEILPVDAAITTTKCFSVYRTPAWRGLNGITCNGDGYTSKPSVAILMEGMAGLIQNVHIEHFTTGIELGTGAEVVADMVVENIESGPDNDTSIYIHPIGATTSQNIMIFGVANSTMGSNTLIDGVNGNTVDNTVGLGFYVMGNGGSGTQTVISSRNDVSINLQTSMTLLKNLLIPGTGVGDGKICLGLGDPACIFAHDFGASGENGLVIQTNPVVAGHPCLLIQQKDQSPSGPIGGGACINGNGYTNDPSWAAIGGGYTGDMGTLIARAAALSGIFFQNGIINFNSAIGQTPGSTASILTMLRLQTNGSLFWPNPVHFASLGSPTNGTYVYCDNCTNASNPCTGSGGGAFAKRLAGAWDCR